MTRKPVLKPDEFSRLEPKKQWKEIHAALSKIPSGRLSAAIDEKEGHVFVPCDEGNKRNLEIAKGYHNAETHEEAIRLALSNYITGKNGDIVQVDALLHEGVPGFRVVAKKS